MSHAVDWIMARTHLPQQERPPNRKVNTAVSQVHVQGAWPHGCRVRTERGGDPLYWSVFKGGVRSGAPCSPSRPQASVCGTQGGGAGHGQRKAYLMLLSNQLREVNLIELPFVPPKSWVLPSLM